MVMFKRRKKKPMEEAVKLLDRLMKEGNSIEAAMVEMRKKGIASMEVVISLTKVLHMSFEEADETVLYSRAYGDIKDETLRLRGMAHGVFMDEADEIIRKPDGKTVLRFDLEKED